MPRIVFCAALPVEVKALCARLGVAVPTQRDRVTRVRAPGGEGEWWIVASGVGAANMRRMLHSLPDEPVEVWASLGLAGGLRPGVKAGDILHGTVVVGNDEHPGPDLVLPEEIVGSVLYCSEKPLCSVDEKRDAFARTGADAVDMESAAVARWAMERGERFAFARVISDGAEEAIDPKVMRCLGGDGFPSTRAALAVMARRPWLLPALLHLGARSERLSARLAEAGLELAERISR